MALIDVGLDLSASELASLLKEDTISIERGLPSGFQAESIIGNTIEATHDVVKGKIQVLVSAVEDKGDDLVNVRLQRQGTFVPATNEELAMAAQHEAIVDSRARQIVAGPSLFTGVMNVAAANEDERSGPWKQIQPAPIGEKSRL